MEKQKEQNKKNRERAVNSLKSKNLNRIVLMGDSVGRHKYKDLVKLMDNGGELTHSDLTGKGERNFQNDQLMRHNGFHNTEFYIEERKKCINGIEIRFYFITSAFYDYVEYTIQKLVEFNPDVVLIMSCYWDINWLPEKHNHFINVESRAVNDLRQNERFLIYENKLRAAFDRFRKCLPQALIVWGTSAHTGKDTEEVNRYAELTGVDETTYNGFIDKANSIAKQEVSKHERIILLDFCKDIVRLDCKHADDGIHWNSSSYRKQTWHLLEQLTHYASTAHPEKNNFGTNYSKLCIAIIHNKKDEVKKILDCTPDSDKLKLLLEKDEFESSALMLALKTNSNVQLKMLILETLKKSAGDDSTELKNEVNECISAYICWSGITDDKQVLRDLLNMPHDRSHSNRLWMAVKLNKVLVITELINYLKNQPYSILRKAVMFKDSEGSNILMLAVSTRPAANEAVVKMIIGALTSPQDKQDCVLDRNNAGYTCVSSCIKAQVEKKILEKVISCLNEPQVRTEFKRKEQKHGNNCVQLAIWAARKNCKDRILKEHLSIIFSYITPADILDNKNDDDERITDMVRQIPNNTRKERIIAILKNWFNLDELETPVEGGHQNAN